MGTATTFFCYEKQEKKAVTADMLMNKLCSCTLSNATRFVRSSNWSKYELAKGIRLPVDQNIKTLSHCCNLNSGTNLTQFKSNLPSYIEECQKFKCLPPSNVLIQHRMSSTSADHVRLWQIERITSAALPILLPASLMLENSLIDSLLAVLVVIHTHWGLEALIVDYARPIVVGTIVPKVLHLLLSLLSALTLAGLLVLIYKGPGIAKTVKDLWNIGKEESAHK